MQTRLPQTTVQGKRRRILRLSNFFRRRVDERAIRAGIRGSGIPHRRRDFGLPGVRAIGEKMTAGTAGFAAAIEQRSAAVRADGPVVAGAVRAGRAGPSGGAGGYRPVIGGARRLGVVVIFRHLPLQRGSMGNRSCQSGQSGSPDDSPPGSVPARQSATTTGGCQARSAADNRLRAASPAARHRACRSGGSVSSRRARPPREPQ